MKPKRLNVMLACYFLGMTAAAVISHAPTWVGFVFSGIVGVGMAEWAKRHG